jgi:c-di-GMP-binding flagellar brake protein YcgR
MEKEYKDKRKSERFKIPNAKVRYKKTSLLRSRDSLSTAFPFLNLSTGGMAFKSKEKFNRDEKILVQLMVPKEPSLNLRARVRWQGKPDSSGTRFIGVKFMPFRNQTGFNPIESFHVLKRLEEQYRNKEKEDFD